MRLCDAVVKTHITDELVCGAIICKEIFFNLY